MLEQVYKLTSGNEKVVEKIIADDNINYFHMIFKNGDGMPEHFTDSNVYMTIIRGNISIDVNEQGIHEYGAGTLLTIPIKTKMSVKNLHDETLELIIVKSPAPIG